MTTQVASVKDAVKLAIDGGTPVSAEGVPMIAVRLTDAQIDAAVEVMRSGMLAQGKNVVALEEGFAGATQAKHAVACANGTCALQLAYDALIEPGDEVLVCAWTYIATASMIVARGATPVWVDADPDTYCIDVDDARSKVTGRTAAIAPTHLYGNPVDIDAVQSLALDHGLAVVYDAAQAHLASYDGEGLGSFGDAVTYSFYPTKNMTTAEGGMTTTNDEVTAGLLRSSRSHGEAEKYVHDRIGFNYRMSDVEAAVGRLQLADLPALTAKRRAHAAAYDRAFASVEGIATPAVTPKAEHAYHLYPIRLETGRLRAPREGYRTIRDEVQAALKAEGVGSAVHYPRSLTRQPVFDRPGVAHQPVSDRLADELLCIPVHQFLSEKQVGETAEGVHKVLRAVMA